MKSYKKPNPGHVFFTPVASGEAASIADMCITPHEFSARLGVFGHYCPVSLALKNELYDCSTEPLLQYAAEFRGDCYILLFTILLICR